MTLVANARMYAVSPRAEEAWDALFAQVSRDAGVALQVLKHPAPAPLDALWARPDMGAVFMCGFPLALGLHPAIPVAAPIPAQDWAKHSPVYRSDLVVAADSTYRTLEDTFGGKVGWTVNHSHSGYNALRHHLLPYRSVSRPRLFAESIGPLVTPLAVARAAIEGRIDVGPLDAVAHALMQRYLPEIAGRLRTVASTDVAPIPPLVASPGVDPAQIAAMRMAFVGAATRSWFPPLGEALGIEGFAAVQREDYALTLAWRDEAEAQGYHQPG